MTTTQIVLTSVFSTWTVIGLLFHVLCEIGSYDTKSENRAIVLGGPLVWLLEIILFFCKCF